MGRWFKKIFLLTFVVSLLSACDDVDVYKKMNDDSVVKETERLVEGFYLVTKQNDFKEQNEFSVADHWDLKNSNDKDYYDTKIGYLAKEIINEDDVLFFMFDKQHYQKRSEEPYLICYSLLNKLAGMDVLYGFNVDNENVIEREEELNIEHWREKVCKNYIYVDKFEKLTIAIKKDEFKKFIEEDLKNKSLNIKEFRTTRITNKGILNIIYSYQYPNQKEFLVNPYLTSYLNKEGKIRYNTKMGVLFEHKMIDQDRLLLKFGKPEKNVDNDNILACKDFLISMNKLNALYGFNLESENITERPSDLNKPDIFSGACEGYLRRDATYSYLSVIIKIGNFQEYVKKTI